MLNCISQGRVAYFGMYLIFVHSPHPKKLDFLATEGNQISFSNMRKNVRNKLAL